MEDKIEVFQKCFGEINISSKKGHYLFIHQYFGTIENDKIAGLSRLNSKMKIFQNPKPYLETLKLVLFPFIYNIKMHFKFNSMQIYSKYICWSMESPGSQRVKRLKILFVTKIDKFSIVTLRLST